jgi:hypothetical protein
MAVPLSGCLDITLGVFIEFAEKDWTLGFVDFPRIGLELAESTFILGWWLSRSMDAFNHKRAGRCPGWGCCELVWI